jgi:hypothetical protein
VKHWQISCKSFTKPSLQEHCGGLILFDEHSKHRSEVVTQTWQFDEHSKKINSILFLLEQVKSWF